MAGSIFPPEVWGLILEKVTHSEDILNVLRAFPELDKVFESKRTEWLVGVILPHLMTKHLVNKKYDLDSLACVDSRELLKLRLVSKRWKNAVEKALEDQVDPSPENPFKCTRMGAHKLGATRMLSLEHMDQFMKDFENEENPFPGKFVIFEPASAFDGIFEGDPTFQQFVLKAVQVLEKFGVHIRFLFLAFGDDNSCHLEMCKAILKGLSCVPNLKGLWMEGNLSGPNLPTNEFFGEASKLVLFPKLEKLEKFELRVNSERNAWVEALFSCFAGSHAIGLRKLALDYKFWNAEMAANLRNLTELHLLLDETKDYTVEEIRNVLRLFPNGQLNKFCLSDYLSVKDNREIYIDQLLGMLDEFQIENVTLEKINLKEAKSEIDAFGITSLHLDDCVGLNYEFLKRLPNLKFLSVRLDRRINFQLTQGQQDEDSFGFKVRQYFWNADKGYEWKGDGSFNIFEECTSLELLSATLETYSKISDVQFLREYGNKPFWGPEAPEEDDDSEGDEDEDD